MLPNQFSITFIIRAALDPARPLIAPGIGNRLDSGDAKSVQVMHTNAGYYGEGGRVGHVDFCVNGGKRQPYCSSTSSNISFNSIIHYITTFNSKTKSCTATHTHTFSSRNQTQICAVTFGPFVIYLRASMIARLWTLNPAQDDVRLVFVVFETIDFCIGKMSVSIFQWVNTLQWSNFPLDIPFLSYCF